MPEIVTITPPAVYPVTLAEAKDQVRVDGDFENSVIERMIAAATAHAESYLRRRLIEQVVDLRVAGFAAGFLLPLAPVIGVESVHYIDPDGDVQTWDGAVTLVGVQSPRVMLAGPFPATAVRSDAVRLRLRVGFGATPAAVPDDIRHAILMLVGHFHGNREAVVVGTGAVSLPLAVDALLRPRVFWF